MLFLVWRKILSHKGLIACLLVGSILAVAMICMIPLYTDGILQRLLRKDMQVFQEETLSYPAQYLFTSNLTYDTQNGFDNYLEHDETVNGSMVRRLHMFFISDNASQISIRLYQ